MAQPNAVPSSALGALSGPLHGGANEDGMALLDSIGSPQRAGAVIEEMIANKTKVPGFGHRVYKNFDPRATIIKVACDKLLAKLHIKDPIFDVAQQLEEIALNDPYFVERKLYPNVDFYSGVIYRSLGIP